MDLGCQEAVHFFSGHRFSHALDATLGNGDEGGFLESRNRLSGWLTKRFLPHDQEAGQAPGALSPSSSAGGLMKAVSCSDTTRQKPAGPRVAWGSPRGEAALHMEMGAWLTRRLGRWWLEDALSVAQTPWEA